jgi:hypothetical protein
MHLLAISLLAILAGTLLLIKTRKEVLGKFFACVSWFFIVVGFILFIGFLVGGICRLTHHPVPGRPGFRHEMMMNGPRHVMPAGICCPGEKGKVNCDKRLDCMQHGSMMKGCPMHLEGDSTKMPCPMHLEGDTTKMPGPKAK